MILRIRRGNTKLNDYFFALILLVCFFFPTSRKEEVMDYKLINFSYLFLILVLSFLTTTEIRKRIFNKTAAYLCIMALFFLFGFTAITALRFNWLIIDNGTIMKCLLMFMIINYTFDHNCDKNAINIALLIATIVIIFFGVCMILGIGKTNLFLKKYYTDHVSFFYNIMMRKHKPVTFFVTHSISAFVYFLLYFCWETQTYFGKIISFVMKIMLMILLVFLQSSSSILCLGIIIFYKFVMKKVKTFFDAFIKMILVIAFISALMYVWGDVANVLFSSKTGFGGRYTVKTGGLVVDLNYVLHGGIPSGLLTLDKLLYTDSGYLVNMLRGGIVYTICVYALYYIRLKNAIGNNWIMKIFYWSTMLFEFGYPLLMNQRYVAALLLSVYCVKVNTLVQGNGIESSAQLTKGDGIENI